MTEPLLLSLNGRKSAKTYPGTPRLFGGNPAVRAFPPGESLAAFISAALRLRLDAYGGAQAELREGALASLPPDKPEWLGD